LGSTGIGASTINTANITSEYLNVLTAGSITYLNSTGITTSYLTTNNVIINDGVTILNSNINITNGNLYATNYNNTNNTYYGILPGYKGTSFQTSSSLVLNDLCVTYDISGSGIHYFFGDVEMSNNLTITGNLYATSVNAITITETSDYRIKENVEQLDQTFNVENLNPVTYTNKLTNKKDVGFIAHEVQSIYPFLVMGEKDDKDFQSLNYIGLIPILTNEIKNIRKELFELKSENLQLNDKIQFIIDNFINK
jgi:hypothetical protein